VLRVGTSSSKTYFGSRRHEGRLNFGGRQLPVAPTVDCADVGVTETVPGARRQHALTVLPRVRPTCDPPVEGVRDAEGTADGRDIQVGDGLRVMLDGPQ
jgi:hypothetical protein